MRTYLIAAALLLAVACGTESPPPQFEVLRDAHIQEQGEAGILVTALIKNNGEPVRGEAKIRFFDHDGTLLFSYIDDKTPVWESGEVWDFQVSMDADSLKVIVEQSKGGPYPLPVDGYVGSVRLTDVDGSPAG